LDKLFVCYYRLDKLCLRNYACSFLTFRGDVNYCPIFLAVKFPARKVKRSPVPQGALVYGNKFCQRRNF
jgi:hypothetical protein